MFLIFIIFHIGSNSGIFARNHEPEATTTSRSNEISDDPFELNFDSLEYNDDPSEPKKRPKVQNEDLENDLPILTQGQNSGITDEQALFLRGEQQLSLARMKAFLKRKS